MQKIICVSLRNFACLAYPKAENSECNLVASDALNNAAEVFEKEYIDKGTGIINRRMRRLLNTAIEAHYNIIAEVKKCSTKYQCEVMLKVCAGELVDDEALDVAESLDVLNGSD